MAANFNVASIAPARENYCTIPIVLRSQISATAIYLGAATIDFQHRPIP